MDKEDSGLRFNKSEAKLLNLLLNGTVHAGLFSEDGDYTGSWLEFVGITDEADQKAFFKKLGV